MTRILCVLTIIIAGINTGHCSYQTGGVVKTILSNGLIVLVRPEPEAPVTAIQIFIRTGAAEESASEEGIGNLLAGSILAGTKTRSTAKLARLVSEVGGNFHAAWNWDYLEVYAVTVPVMADETIALLADSIQRSRLDSVAIDNSRAAMLRNIEQHNNDLFTSAHSSLRRLVQRNNVYDRPFIGEPENIQRISREQIRQFYERNITADRIVISVVGNVEPWNVIRKIEVCFQNMPRGRANDQIGRTLATARSSGRKEIIERDSPITYIMVGYPAPGVQDNDHHAMAIANVLLGGNKSSLLFRNLREEKGLGYQVGSVYPSLRHGSHVAAFLGIDADRASKDVLETVESVILEKVELLKEGNFTDDDIERAKRFLIGNHALKRERTRDRAHSLGWFETMGLGYQYDFQYPEKIKQVKKEDVVNVSREYFTEPVVVIVGPRIEAD